MGTERRETSVVVGSVLSAALGNARAAFGGAQLIPEIQHRLGACPDGSSCSWDCGGAQCVLGFDQQICSENGECQFGCTPGPVCTDGKKRKPCALPSLAAFTGRLVVRVDERDSLCAPGTCVPNLFDSCGSMITIGLRGRKQDGGEFVIQKDINACGGVLPCGQDLNPPDSNWDRDCNQCLDGFTFDSDCPRVDPVLLCNGQQANDVRESDVDFGGQFGIWLNDMQPVDVLRADLPQDLQTGVPVVVSAKQNAFGKFCGDSQPHSPCVSDVNCSTGERDDVSGFCCDCYAEAEFCVTVALVEGRCLGGSNEGVLCTAGAGCDSGHCGLASV